MAYRFLFSLLFPICFSATVAAQNLIENPATLSKISPELRSLLNKTAATNPNNQSASPYARKQRKDTILTIIHCSNQKEVCASLQKKGIPFKHIITDVISARLTPSLITEFAPLAAIKYLSGPKRVYKHLDKSRAASKVDEVHSGTNLETPYTGKNVLIGIIDQGFNYAHAAFRVSPDSTRIISVYEISENGEEAIYEGSSNIISKKEDTFESESHATHVMGIAAGGNVYNDTYYGYAPDARIIAASNYFDYASLFNSIAHIKDIAQRFDEPFVINMSFGTNIYEHDGANMFSTILDSLSEEGCIFVSSAGNDRTTLCHASHKYTEEQDTCYLVIVPNDELISLQVVSQDSTSFELSRPVIYDPKSHKYLPISDNSWESILKDTEYYSESNNRFCYYTNIPKEVISKEFGNENKYLCIRIKGKPNHQIDAFLESTCKGFTNDLKDSLPNASYDNKVNINWPSGSRSVVCVASYNTKNAWKSINGNTTNWSQYGKVDEMSYFSSIGPTLDPTILKPNVCAPGFLISSSVKQEYNDNSPKYITQKVTLDGQNHYYGIMMGTSMSTPAVTGAIALWLQANPRLNYKDILNIIEKTSRSDESTGPCYNEEAGFGKLDVYEGLKMALTLTDIESLHNSNTPISILKQEQAWKILFNSQESYANLAIYNIEGQLISQQAYKQLNAGDEQIVSFSNLPSGIYLLRIQTPNHQSTYKFIVK